MFQALVNSKFPQKAINALAECGARVILLPEWSALSAPMSSHPDMIMFAGLGHIVCHRSYYLQNKSLVDAIARDGALSLILSDEEVSPLYPHDAVFNAALVGNSLICNTKTVSRHILEIAKEKRVNIVHVNQGYAKCSTLVAGENDIVTSDRGIHAAAQRAGINSLLIGAGSIRLAPYEYGFIGGATGMCGATVFFCGELESHPDKQQIEEFIALCGKKCTILPFDDLSDMGSILFSE